MSASLLLSDRTRETLNDALSGGGSPGGWLFAGPQGIGKAQVARAFGAAHLSRVRSLDGVDPTIALQVAQDAHPDLQVLARVPHEKTGKLNSAIRVDDVRAATGRLFKTTATGRRVVIVDTADDLNQNAANALLKSLEEPPVGTAFILLTRAVGGLLPTIRSRCRIVNLPPLNREQVATWLVETRGADAAEAAEAARLGGGAPGRALSLLEDPRPITLADSFIAAALGGRDLVGMAEEAGARINDDAWPAAWALVTERISAALRGADDPLLSKYADTRLLAAMDEAKTLASRAAGLNADRTHAVLVLGQTLGRAARASR